MKGYASIAEPLHRLTRKSAKFVWTADCPEAFEALKCALTTAPVLAYPEFDRPFTLYGAILSQESMQVIAYYSRQLSKAEWNYSTTA